MVITRLLSQNDYGIWSYVLNMYSYLGLITGFGLISGALQFGTENKGVGKAYNYFKYCTKNGLFINLCILIVFGIIIAVLELPIEGAKPFILIVAPMLLVEYLIAMGQSVLRSQNRIREYANVLNVGSITTAVGTCGGAFFGLYGVVIGRYLASAITVIYTQIIIRGNIREIIHADVLSKKERGDLWHYSALTGASSAMNCLVYVLDITLIAALDQSAIEIGIYRVGTLIPTAMQFIPTSVIISVLPNIVYNRNNIDYIRKNIRKVYIGLCLLNIVILAIIIPLSPYIINLFSGERYIESASVLRILTLGYFFSGTFRNLSVNLLAAFRRVKFGLFISILSCGLDVILNYYFIISNGMIGAAYATLVVDFITGMIAFAYVIYLIRKGTINEIH